MPCRYEYVTSQFDFNNPSSFNELGSEGWELVTCVPVDTLIVGVFKRPIEEPSPLLAATERVNAPYPFANIQTEIPQYFPEFPPAPPPNIPLENIQQFDMGDGYVAFYHYP